MRDISRGSSLFLLAACFIIIISPVLHDGVWAGFDWQAHTLRFTSIKHAIENGQFPPTFDYWTDTQYAYPWSIFYAPLSNLYFMASVLTLHGFSNEVQIKTSIVLIMLTACITSFFVSLKRYNSYRASAMASVMFLTTGYFLSNIYIRFSIGELLAFSLTPIYIFGLICILEDKNGKWYATIGATLIFLSNIPLFICAFIYFVLTLAISPKSFLDKENIKFYIYSGIFIVGATCFYWLPLAFQAKATGIYAFSGLKNNFDYMYKVSATILEVIFPVPTSSASSAGKLLSVNTISFFICCYLFCKKKTDKSENKILFASVVSTIIATNIFPWFLIPDSIPIIGAMQFPWRMIGLSAFGFCLVSCKVAGNGWKTFMLLFTICISLSIFPLKKAWNESFKFQNSSLYVDYLNNSAYENKSYLQARDNRMALLSLRPFKYKNGYPIYKTIDQKIITLPVLWYNGYFAIVNGEKRILTEHKNGLVAIDELPKNSTIEIGFDTRIINLAYIISLLTIVLFLFLFYRFKASD
ncbi:hypothetical protein ABFO88_001008 [Enterobacter hormaechei]